MRRLIFSLICSSGNAVNVLKPTNVGIPSSQIRIAFARRIASASLLRTLAGQRHASGNGLRVQQVTPGLLSGAQLLPLAAVEYGAAGGVEIALVSGHAD